MANTTNIEDSSPGISLTQHLAATTPKRILALDGGGVRGMLSLGILSEIEDLLAKRWAKSKGTNEKDFRLCDYFDLIGGTSTGAIIAAALAIGKSVEEIAVLYRLLLPKVFKRTARHTQLLTFKAPRYSRGPLLKELEMIFGSTTTLPDPSIKTGLMITAKRLDTKEVYVFHNNPNDIHNKAATGPYLNNAYTLAKIVRASTAAPTYFPPEHFPSSRKAGNLEVFVDGGVSPLNNPALGAFMVATINGFGYKWKKGEDNILLVSVGTGWFRSAQKYSVQSARIPRNILRDVMDSLINDSDWLGQGLLQWMSNTKTPHKIHGSMGTLANESLAGQPLLTYLRYTENIPPALGKLDDATNSTRLYNRGKSAGSADVKPRHFPSTFDI